MRSNAFKTFWVISLLIAVSISCNLTSTLKREAMMAQKTAYAALTELEKMATIVESSGLVKTAQAIATLSGREVKYTLEALATEIGESDLLKTAQVYLTEEGSTIKATLEVAKTKLEEEEVLETAQALITEGVSVGEAPSDIPIVDMGTVTNFIGSQHLVAYTSTLETSVIRDFYLNEMPNNGWVFLQIEAHQNAIILYFEKNDRKATVNLITNPFDNDTIVNIIITPK